MQILVNGKRYYGINGDTTEHAIFKFLKIPEPINEITVVIQGDKLLTSKKSFKTVLGEKRYKIIVSPPYPRTFDCLPYPYQPEWYQLPLDSIKRDVTIKPDTSKNNVIL